MCIGVWVLISYWVLLNLLMSDLNVVAEWSLHEMKCKDHFMIRRRMLLLWTWQEPMWLMHFESELIKVLVACVALSSMQYGSLCSLYVWWIEFYLMMLWMLWDALWVIEVLDVFEMFLVSFKEQCSQVGDIVRTLKMN